MSYALVGTIGAVSTGASGASVSPAFGTGETRTAGNLLLLWVAGSGSGTLPSAPSGWSTAIQKAGSNGTASASLFYKVAAGSDAAPTVGAVASTVLSAQLAEFSGGATSSPVDQTGTATSTTSTVTATAGGADLASGELVAYCTSENYVGANVQTNSVALNNGATANSTNNNGTSTVNHYVLGYGITTGHASADAATLTFTSTGTVFDTAVAEASFKLLGAAVPPPIPMLRCSQAVARSSVI